MKTHYGNLADAALGERRFAHGVHEGMKSAAQKAQRARVKPATLLLVGLGLAIIGLTALAVLDVVPDRLAAAAPRMADIEDWLIWGELHSY